MIGSLLFDNVRLTLIKKRVSRRVLNDFLDVKMKIFSIEPHHCKCNDPELTHNCSQARSVKVKFDIGSLIGYFAPMVFGALHSRNLLDGDVGQRGHRG